MKKLILLFLTMFTIISIGKGQDINLPDQPDIRLYEVYDATYISMLQEKNPNLIKYYNFFLDNSFFITELSAEKMNQQNMTVVSLKGNDTPQRLNILNYDLKRDFKLYKHYQIGSSNKAIVMLPEEEFMKLYNKARKIN